MSAYLQKPTFAGGVTMFALFQAGFSLTFKRVEPTRAAGRRIGVIE
jgi:hypothetical protein